MSQGQSKIPSLKRLAGRAKELTRNEGLTLTEAYAQIASAYGFTDWATGFTDWATMKSCIPANPKEDRARVWHGRNGVEVHIIESETPEDK